jgi:hypothetical protein
MSTSPQFIHTWTAIFDRVIPETIQVHAGELRAARQLTLLAAVTAASVPLLTMMYHFLGYDAAGMVVLTAGIVMMLAPFAMNAGLCLSGARDLFIGALFLLKIWMALHLGGLAAPTVPWFVLCPLVAFLLGGTRAGLIWAGLVMTVFFVIFGIEQASGPLVAFPVSSPAVLQLVSLVGLTALLCIIALCFKANSDAAAGRRKLD